MARKRPKINTSVYPLFCGRCFTVRALLKSNKMIHVDLKDAVLHMLRNLPCLGPTSKVNSFADAIPRSSEANTWVSGMSCIGWQGSGLLNAARYASMSASM